MYAPLSLISLFVLVNAQREIPDYIHICHRNDPNVADCIKTSVELLRPRLKEGIPELDVPSLDPFYVPDHDLVMGSPSFKLLRRNTVAYGVSDFEIVKLKVNIPDLTFGIQVLIPLIIVEGDFDISAQILIPFKGQGRYSMNASRAFGDAVLHAEPKDGNGEDHLHFIRLELKINVPEYHISLSSPNSGGSLLSKTANMVNQNKKLFLDILMPVLERQLSVMLLDIANRITKNFKYDEVFPEK
ncbi:hypothetical protein PPYR_08245 [Photinus pyralis]|uniref:Uncharacterized protein n=1 Tax=Photinus pyralis TaxID=7054 RepID=A0A5N4AIV4_PHOPY|nr:uncharacterized protein LOC116172124 [Photinus pyralis]XP_031345127.1 uncharacterized protein LOC116172124 [Photinus pyralis]XP_031345128.1 uncharacterized protein LOC116172124 [Photinus pyralis]KAB0797251.1 hypothetical protein PPYR_08245 [Photinus pyralis]